MLKKIYEEKAQVKSIIFSKNKWSLEDAKKWLKIHGYKVSDLEEKEKSYRFIQEPKEDFKSFAYSKEKKPGLKFLYGIK
jgi:hypothetical protein